MEGQFVLAGELIKSQPGSISGKGTYSGGNPTEMRASVCGHVKHTGAFFTVEPLFPSFEPVPGHLVFGRVCPTRESALLGAAEERVKLAVGAIRPATLNTNNLVLPSAELRKRTDADVRFLRKQLGDFAVLEADVWSAQGKDVVLKAQQLDQSPRAVFVKVPFFAVTRKALKEHVFDFGRVSVTLFVADNGLLRLSSSDSGQEAWRRLVFVRLCLLAMAAVGLRIDTKTVQRVLVETEPLYTSNRTALINEEEGLRKLKSLVS